MAMGGRCEERALGLMGSSSCLSLFTALPPPPLCSIHHFQSIAPTKRPKQMRQARAATQTQITTTPPRDDDDDDDEDRRRRHRPSTATRSRVLLLLLLLLVGLAQAVRA